MDLSVMLEYQKIDTEIMKLENELLSSDAAREFASNKRIVANAQEQVMKQNRDAGDLIQQMNALIAEYDKVEKELKETEESMHEVQDLCGAEFYQRNMQKLIGQLQSLARDISAVNNKIMDINRYYTAAMNQGREATKTLSVAKAKYDDEKSKLMPKATELKEKFSKIEKECSPEFLVVYKRLRQQKKLPCAVPLMDGRSCGGCFMELSGGTLEKLKGGMIECPNCGRILYKQ